jgi:hypothetical protein
MSGLRMNQDANLLDPVKMGNWMQKTGQRDNSLEQE